MFRVPKHTKMYMFADDTALMSVHKDLLTAVENLQKDFSNIQRWSQDMSITLNEGKTKIIPIHVPKTEGTPLTNKTGSTLSQLFPSRMSGNV